MLSLNSRWSDCHLQHSKFKLERIVWGGYALASVHDLSVHSYSLMWKNGQLKTTMLCRHFNNFCILSSDASCDINWIFDTWNKTNRSIKLAASIMDVFCSLSGLIWISQILLSRCTKLTISKPPSMPLNLRSRSSGSMGCCTPCLLYTSPSPRD